MAKFESAVIDGDNIAINKKELEEWIDYYMNESNLPHHNLWEKWYCLGKASMLMDLKEHFNEEELTDK